MGGDGGITSVTGRQIGRCVCGTVINAFGKYWENTSPVLLLTGVQCIEGSSTSCRNVSLFKGTNHNGVLFFDSFFSLSFCHSLLSFCTVTGKRFSWDLKVHYLRNKCKFWISIKLDQSNIYIHGRGSDSGKLYQSWLCVAFEVRFSIELDG